MLVPASPAPIGKLDHLQRADEEVERDDDAGDDADAIARAAADHARCQRSLRAPATTSQTTQREARDDPASFAAR